MFLNENVSESTSGAPSAFIWYMNKNCPIASEPPLFIFNGVWNQVNGKVKSKIVIAADTPKEELRDLAISNPKISSLLSGKEIRKEIRKEMMKKVKKR